MSIDYTQRGETRRSFLKDMALAGGALAAGACSPGLQAAGSGAGSPVRADRIGLQLYTVRDQMEKDFTATLERVAQIGYREVEFAGYFNHTPEQVRQLLDRLGLRSPSVHVGLADLRRDLPGAIRSAKVVGQGYITVPALDEAFSGGKLDLAFWQRTAAELNRIGAAVRAEGLKLAYHNHNFEFDRLENGRTGWDVLLEQTDPANLVFELDLLWASFAGADPVQLFQRSPGRYPLWHVKDIRGLQAARAAVPANPTTMQAIETAAARLTAVGTGDMDFMRIFAQARTAGMQHFFVENDSAAANGASSLADIETSFRNLARMLG
jgi:sugar phosphate isomerase/epimerase